MKVHKGALVLPVTFSLIDQFISEGFSMAQLRDQGFLGYGDEGDNILYFVFRSGLAEYERRHVPNRIAPKRR
jgi:hypothetical protein